MCSQEDADHVIVALPHRDMQWGFAWRDSEVRKKGHMATGHSVET